MAKRAAILFCCVFCLADHGIASQCPLPWNAIYDRGGNMIDINYSMPCPYGTRLPGSVTLPKRSGSAWEDFINLICVGWGYTPFVIMALSAFELFVVGPFCLFFRCCTKMRRRFYRCCVDRKDDVEWRIGTRELSFAVFCIVIVIINEGLLKRVWNQPRPQTSCCYSCGLPSGHSTYAVGFFTLMFLDGSYRVLSKEPSTLEEAIEELNFIKKNEKGGNDEFDKLKKNLRRCNLVRVISVIPLSKGDSISHIEFVVFAMFWAVVLLPTPVSRIRLGDHSPLQIAVGASIGVLEAFIWFYCVRRGQHCCNTYIGRTFFGLRHNFALPRQEVASACVRLLADKKCEKGSSLRDRSARREELESMQEMLWYYIDLTVDREWRARKGKERRKNLLDADEGNERSKKPFEADLEKDGDKSDLQDDEKKDPEGGPHFLSLRDWLLPDRVFLTAQFYTLKKLMDDLHEQLCETFFNVDETWFEGTEKADAEFLGKLLGTHKEGQEVWWDTSPGIIRGKRERKKMTIRKAVEEAEQKANCAGFYYQGEKKAFTDPEKKDIDIYFVEKTNNVVDKAQSCCWCCRTFTRCTRDVPSSKALKVGDHVEAKEDIRLGRGGEGDVTVRRVTVKKGVLGQVSLGMRLWDPVVKEYLVAVKWEERVDEDKFKHTPLWTRPSQLFQKEGENSGNSMSQSVLDRATTWWSGGSSAPKAGCPTRNHVQIPLIRR